MPPRNFDRDDDDELDSDACYDEDSDDTDDEDENFDDESEDDEDDEEVLAEIERGFRSDRARIRASEDLQDLRGLRAEYIALANSGGNSARSIRARDLLEIVDDRITDLKAREIARRRW